MQVYELLGIAVGLSMDAFAVSLCQGLSMKKLDWGQALLTALFFGVFQALMPTIGYYIGAQFEQYIALVDHWVAFALLGFIGGKMLFDALRKKDTESAEESKTASIGRLFVLAIATSIDALAVGITFPSLLAVPLWLAVLLIGLTTFLISLGGVVIGNRFGTRYQKKAEIFGGCVLIALGIKIMIEGIFA